MSRPEIGGLNFNLTSKHVELFGTTEKPEELEAFIQVLTDLLPVFRLITTPSTPLTAQHERTG